MFCVACVALHRVTAEAPNVGVTIPAALAAAAAAVCGCLGAWVNWYPHVCKHMLRAAAAAAFGAVRDRCCIG
jgi:hypothetical protein